jgi:hypothetical protein
MKLELKHLAPYLPYRLKLKAPYGFRPNGKESTGASRIVYLTGDLYADIENNTFNGEVFKPILRPISDLTKEIEVNGEKFYPLLEIGIIIDDDYLYLDEDENGIIVGKDVNPRCGCPYDCNCMSYTYNLFYSDFNFYSTVYQDGNENDMVNEIVHESFILIQKLFEWHFDVFGLIENDLAIDINTL